MTQFSTWLSDIYFIGGFSAVAWVNVKEYEAMKPDKIAAVSGEQNLKVASYSYLYFVSIFNIIFVR